MKSHGIPFLTKMKTGSDKQGRQQDPEQGEVRFHTGTRFHSIRDPARERADISPRWRAQLDAQRWDRRRIEQWQQLDPPYSF
jgi:hypothetical protein